MDRKTQVHYTNTFNKEYAYSSDSRDHFIKYWLYPYLLNKVFESRGEAYKAIDAFIKDVKENFKWDYSNTLIPNIRKEWFYLSDYQEPEEEYYH